MSKSSFAIAVGALVALIGTVTPSMAAQKTDRNRLPRKVWRRPSETRSFRPFAQAIAIIGQSGTVIRSKNVAVVTTHPPGLFA